MRSNISFESRRSASAAQLTRQATMVYVSIVLAVGLLAGAILFGVAHLVVSVLPRIFAWRSPLRLLMVLVVWFVVSAALVWPCYAMLFASAAVVDVWDETWRLVWWSVCYALSLLPFGVVVSRHRDRIVDAAKHALVAEHVVRAPTLYERGSVARWQ